MPDASAPREPAGSPDQPGLTGRVADLVEDAVEGAVDKASGAVGGAVGKASGAVGKATGAVGGAVEKASDAVGGALGGVRGVARAAHGRWDERPGARVRRVRRRGREPLPYLYAVHPDARFAAPRELGIETIDLDRIAGTAVGGVTQRGGDFLPLKPFRSTNWQGRWQRIRQALDRLTVLPPIDVLRYADRYWVLDGHNRVAAALYAGAVGIDANVVELVPPGALPSERPAHLAAVLTGSRAVRTAGSGRRVAPVADEDLDRSGGSS